MSLSNPKKIPNLSEERGFVSAWFASITLGAMVAGFTFMYYSEATITKVKTNFMTMNLVTTGAHNAEFDTIEPLNNMKALAKCYGYSGVAVNDTQAQTDATNSTEIFFTRQASPGTTHGVRAYIKLNQNPFLDILGFSPVSTAAYARSEHSPTYIDLSFDYSHSLAGGEITDLLTAFDVINGLTNGPGGNGTTAADGVTVIPNKDIQSLLPYSFDPKTGIARPWSDYSTQWPNKTATVVADCTENEERECNTYSASIKSHETVLRTKASDLFLKYKKAAALLTGIVGMKTQFADVHVFGGRLPDDTYTAVTSSLGPQFSGLQNEGVYTVSEFDEAQYHSYQLAGVPQQYVGELRIQYSYDTPKDLIRGRVSMAPDRVLQSFLDLTFYRKLLKYGQLISGDGSTELEAPETYYKTLSPPLPVLSNYTVPDDSFTFSPGKPADGDVHPKMLPNEVIFPFGWPSHPTPMLSEEGMAFGDSATIPDYIAYPIEYSCETGIPRDNAMQMSTAATSTAQRLCLLHELCTGADYNCDGLGGTALTSLRNAYRVFKSAGDYWSDSSVCAAGYRAKCFTTTRNSDGSFTYGAASTDNAPLCVNGVARCHPDINQVALCHNGTAVAGYPQCCDYTSGACVSYEPSMSLGNVYPQTHTATSSGSASTIGSTGGIPYSRGRLVFPTEAELNTTTNTIFHYLMDLSTIQGGTWTDKAINKSLTRCQAFKSHFNGLNPRCIMIMVTDGVPNGIGAEGTPLVTDGDMLTNVQTEVNNFVAEGGQIFTWYLNHQPSDYSNLVALLESMKAQETLDKTAQDIYDAQISLELPIEDTTGWDATRPAGTPDADTYNNTTLPTHQALSATRSNFKSMMAANSNLKLIESSLSLGNQDPIPEATFFNGLELIAASLKKEVQFQK
jgi:hypothetical protein